MGGAAPVLSKGGRRALDAALNVVPFIDLLSCCLAFLLITAVWTQLAAFEATPGGAGGGDRGATVESVVVYLDEGGHTIARSTGASEPIPKREGGYDFARLGERLAAVRRALPSVAPVTVRAADPVAYQEVIRTMDAAKAARFADVSIAAIE